MNSFARNAIWLAGLLEGEGSFGIHRNSPTIQLRMTDRDVVEHAAQIMGVAVNTPYGPFPRNTAGITGKKTIYACTASGLRAASWMMIVWQFMGGRRQAKIAEIILRWRAVKGWPRSSKGQKLRSVCHPERSAYSFGQCRSCSVRRWRHDQIAKGLCIDCMATATDGRCCARHADARRKCNERGRIGAS